ncbi:MAG: hypothetical protein VKJ66_03565 [Synechococcus sp.]|nr:hypothetical protein [Synechococcus sp.]
MGQPTGHEGVLFAAAQDVARRRGKMDSRRPASVKHSRHTGVSYTLADSDGDVIARLPLWSVQRAARQRALLLSRLAEGRKVWSTLSLGEQRVQFRTRPFEIRALAWALSNGRRVPQGRFDRDKLLTSLLLLLLAVAAGLITGNLAVFLVLLLPWLAFTVLVVKEHRAYRHNLTGLVARWKAAGKPDPGDSLFAELQQGH